jgi:predicted metal-dependent hydrolase
MAVNRNSKALGKSQLKLRVQELQAMWGSCGSNGVVSLDWHLIFAPKKVMQYAVAHDVSHLIET